jgi:hypothetical protein
MTFHCTERCSGLLHETPSVQYNVSHSSQSVEWQFPNRFETSIIGMEGYRQDWDMEWKVANEHVQYVWKHILNQSNFSHLSTQSQNHFRCSPCYIGGESMCCSLKRGPVASQRIRKRNCSRSSSFQSSMCWKEHDFSCQRRCTSVTQPSCQGQ